ncbi:hypothetical protein SAMN05216312_105199 [Cohnella sp. OV330]|uniref:hypothetical protein n=1 Tax=Cohnella sp. OV330 TaxID=1855288 RepID=UPI0008E9593F|nr:hypothetical protein [Cohnella sp. OV330]SFB27931.1 hypothetical protein SAMN05216312_105199 [Cohnella sp. OV330]
MLRQMLILSGLGIAMWALGTLFFMLFGDWVLVAAEDRQFGASLFLLEALTALVILGVALVVRLRLFRMPGSATRFGFIGALIGLLLNTFVLLYRDKVLYDLDQGQYHTFTVWMTLAYALFLLLPAIADRLIRTRPVEDAHDRDASDVLHAQDDPATYRPE